MKKNSPNDLLDEAIDLLESKRSLELFQLKEQMNEVLDSLKPINLIKDTFKKVTTSPDLKSGIGKTAIGVASGLLVKNIIFRKTQNPFKLVVRTMLQTAAVGIAANNSDKIKSKGILLLHTLLSKIKLK